MSEQLSPEMLVRMAWTTELCRQGHRQCRNTSRDDFGNVCAMELLREIIGAPRFTTLGSHAEVGKRAGLEYDQTLGVIARNDGRSGYHRHSFSELAVHIEGLPGV